MNKVVHFEIPADDLANAKSFYATIFGWEFKPWSEDYVSIFASKVNEKGESAEVGAINGGLQKRSLRAKHPTIVIQVDSIDETIEKIEQQGGKVAISKEPVGDMGYYAQFDDPEGNRIGLFQEKK